MPFRDFIIVIVALMLVPCAGTAQENSPTTQEDTTIFPHPDSWFWVSGQANLIFQAHPAFPALYSGTNSLKNSPEHALSRIFTLYTGLALKHRTEFLFDAESTGGKGISDALGLAGFTNVDVVRNPDLGSKPYMARVMVHQTFTLSADTVDADRTPFSLANKLPTRRIELRAGKLSTADFFDVNAIGSDSHLQFTNWTTVNNGAYDYAADTRGYTYGAMIEYQQPNFGIRFGEMLMPKVANGIDLDWNLRRSHSENVEVELRPSIMRGRATTVRVLSYWNTANMGDYREAIAAFRSGLDPHPIIENHRHPGALKYGVGINLEQWLPGGFRSFLRAGWNEGRHESFAYTEVNNTVSFGGDLSGERWRRKLDRVGSAFVSNGLSSEHAEYLRLGGQGFLLGDGSLRYGRETIWETYYTWHVWRGVFASAQLQFVNNPGYNKDRGPVFVPGTRLHVDF